MAVEDITDKEGRVLARHITSSQWEEKGLSFYSQESDFIQVGTWNYDHGKELLAHAHNYVDRSINLTQEVLYIRKGAIRVRVYDRESQLICDRVAKAGDVMILLFGGHGYDILEDDTQVLEVKNGPYLGAEIDRERI